MLSWSGRGTLVGPRLSRSRFAQLWLEKRDIARRHNIPHLIRSSETNNRGSSGASGVGNKPEPDIPAPFVRRAMVAAIRHADGFVTLHSYQHFATEEETESMREGFNGGGLGYVEAKIRLFEAINRTMNDPR